MILKKLELPIVSLPTCQNNLRKTRLGRKFILDPSFVCAGGEDGVDLCKGDGGSPLVCEVDGAPGHYYLAGMSAWGKMLFHFIAMLLSGCTYLGKHRRSGPDLLCLGTPRRRRNLAQEEKNSDLDNASHD